MTDQVLQREKVFERFFQFAPDAMVVITRDGLIREVNFQTERMFGYGRSDLVGQPVEELLPERFRRSHPDHHRDHYARPRLQPMGEGLDLYARHRDGREFPVDIMLSPLEIEGETFVLSVIRNIEERKKTEEALRLSEELFAAIFECAPDAMVMTGEEGRIRRVNSQVEKLFGYDRNDLLGQPVEVLVPERFRGVHPSHRQGYQAQPRIRPMGAGLDLFGRRQDGSEFPVDIMLSSLVVAGQPVVLSLVRDITERRQTEKALRLSEHHFRVLIEGVRDYAIFMLDSNGLVISWSPGAEHIQGYPAEEIIGQHFSRFYTPEDVERGKPSRC